MRGLRSRILRTLKTAAAQSNILLPPPDAAPSPPPRACQRAPSSMAAEVEAVPELAAVPSGDCPGEGDDKENFSPEANPRKAKKMKVSSESEHCHDGGAGPGEAALCYRRPELESASLFNAYT
jgi:glutaredoxin domain-containing cysteine-rich protein 1